MKQAFAIILVAFSSLLYSQTNFKWEKIDSVAKTKDQIYSDSKMFIAKHWKSAQNVIQNDDKEAGVIMARGSITKEVVMMGGLQVYYYTYYYDVSFQMKENKYRIIIDNVVCENTRFSGNASYTPVKIQPFEGSDCPPTGGLPKKPLIEMMAVLKNDLQGIVDSYVAFIKTPGVTKSDW